VRRCQLRVHSHHHFGAFKRELKEQFYPKDAVKEARAKLRHLQHKEGHLREYVREFQELLLEIPNMGEEDALFAFLDGLSGWAKTELERHDVQDLASVVAASESLNEYKKDFSKGRGKKNHGDSDSDRDRDKSPRRDKATTFKDKGRDKKDETLM